MCEKVLVLATAAKNGGAETILRTAISHMSYSKNKVYYIFGGCKNIVSFGAVKYYYFPTNGIVSFIFAVGISPILAWYLKCCKVISFSNICSPQLGFETITYFHQLLFFTNPKEIGRYVYWIYFFVIKFLMKGSTIVIQNELVKGMFISKFGNHYNLIVRWPGIPHARILVDNKKRHMNGAIKRVLFPVSNSMNYKNVPLFLEICKKNKDIYFFSFLSNNYDVSNHVPLGKVEINRVMEEIEKSDAMLFTSMEETLGLPIFEFAITGKPVFVYERPYTKWITTKFPFLNNIYFFNKEIQFDRSYNILKFDSKNIESILNGEWDFL